MHHKAQVVLDFGCATGTVSLALLRKNIRAISADMSLQMLQYLNNEAGKQSLPAIGVACDVEQLPFKDASFDGVICMGVLHHLHNIPKGVGEQVRVLAKEGMIFISEPFSHKPLISYPYYAMYYTARWVVGLFKGKQLTTPERTITFKDIDVILNVFKQKGLEYDIRYFVYWPNICGYLPEAIALGLTRLINALNINPGRGDIVFITARKKT